MKDPAFLFYSSDFLSGISDLTMEERGQYITMLCLQHQKGNLSEKTIRLNVGSVSVDVIAKFKKDSEGNFFNERLLFEIEKRNLFTESRRNNGLKGGRPKKETKPLAKPKNNHMDNHMGDVNEDENVKEKDKKPFPKIEDVISYFQEKGYTVEAAKRAFDFYDVNQWNDSKGNKVLNWKQKMISVWFKDEHKAKPETVKPKYATLAELNGEIK